MQNNYAPTSEVFKSSKKGKSSKKEEKEENISGKTNNQSNTNHYFAVSAVKQEEELFKFLLTFDDIVLGDKLGQGSYGIVYKAKYKGETVACKMINGEEANTEEFLQEAKVMSTIPPHPNVIRLIGFCRLPVCIVSGKK
jgi:hypothetical protein